MVLKDWNKISTWRKDKHYRILNSVPPAFVKHKVTGSSLPAPRGYDWYWNKKSRFAKDPKNRFEKVLVRNKSTRKRNYY